MKNPASISRWTNSKTRGRELHFSPGPALFWLDVVWKPTLVEEEGKQSSVARRERKMEKGGGRQGREKGKGEEKSCPASSPPLPERREGPGSLGPQPPARPSEPAKACAPPRWHPPPLTGCRRPRSARRARCWGAVGNGTWRRLDAGGRGREGTSGRAQALRGTERLRRPLRSCTQRHRRPPRRLSRDFPRGFRREQPAPKPALPSLRLRPRCEERTSFTLSAPLLTVRNA